MLGRVPGAVIVVSGAVVVVAEFDRVIVGAIGADGDAARGEDEKDQDNSLHGLPAMTTAVRP